MTVKEDRDVDQECEEGDLSIRAVKEGGIDLKAS